MGDTLGKIVNEKSDKKSSKAVPWKKMLNNDTDMQLLLFNIITGGGAVGGIISFIASLIIKTPLIQDVAILTALAVLGICIYLANAKKMVRQSAIVIVFCYNFDGISDDVLHLGRSVQRYGFLVWLRHDILIPSDRWHVFAMSCWPSRS